MRKLLSFCLMTLLVTVHANSAFAQDEIDRVVGQWEGYTSNGDLLQIDNAFNEVDWTFSGSTQTTFRATGAAAIDVHSFTVTVVDDQYYQLFFTDPFPTFVEAHWYSDDAVRLIFGDGTIAILARVAETELEYATTAVEQSLLLTLEGQWTGMIVGWDQQLTIEFSITDLLGGRVTATTFESSDVADLIIVGSEDQVLHLAELGDLDDPAAVRFVSPDEIVISAEEISITLSRVRVVEPTTTPTVSMNCEGYCTLAVAAGCSSGPPDFGICVDVCDQLTASHCSDELQAVFACGGASPSFTCSPTGDVILVGCEVENAALDDCL